MAYVSCTFFLSLSFYLWSISHPGRNGTPQLDLCEDEEASVSVENLSRLSPCQLALERVIVKTFTHYKIPLDVSDNIRASFKLKLWRMGKLFSKLGTKNRQTQISRWKEGDDANWMFTVSAREINHQVLCSKRSIEELKEETSKRIHLEQKVKSLQTTVNHQTALMTRNGLELVEIRPKIRKPLVECSRQQKYNRKQQMLEQVRDSVSFCRAEGYDVCSVDVKSMDTGELETFNIRDQNKVLEVKEELPSTEMLCGALLVKDKYSVSHEAYHELSTVSDLPNLYQVKNL